MDTLIEGEDFYRDSEGRMVWTREYLSRRGHCCQSGCTHCPYGYGDRVDPSFPAELQDPWGVKPE